jgi:preprotein translocase subunit YajC
MNREEFESLKFGDKVYRNFGLVGIVIYSFKITEQFREKAEEETAISILWENKQKDIWVFNDAKDLLHLTRE